jgi:hypothetical protein
MGKASANKNAGGKPTFIKYRQRMPNASRNLTKPDDPSPIDLLRVVLRIATIAI